MLSAPFKSQRAKSFGSLSSSLSLLASTTGFFKLSTPTQISNCYSTLLSSVSTTQNRGLLLDSATKYLGSTKSLPPSTLSFFSTSTAVHSDTSLSSSPTSATASNTNASSRYSFIISESYNAKKRPQSLNPASLLPKLDEACSKIEHEIKNSQDVLHDLLTNKNSEISTQELQKIKNQHARYVKALQDQIKEINLERKKINAIVESNLHNPLEFLVASVNDSNKNNNGGESTKFQGYNPLTDLKIFDRNTGEDSYFISPTTGPLASRGVAFGVADGVGGWSAMGVDPSAVSKGLCYYMRKLFCTHLAEQIQSGNSTKKSNGNISNGNGGASLPSPKVLLDTAFSELQNIEHISQKSGSKSAIAGGSTACVGIVSASTGTLHTANLGDSGFAIYRSGKIAYQSEAQVHAFNTPYQLSLVPDIIRRLEDGDFDDANNEQNRNRSKGKRKEKEGRRIMDMPKDADTSSLQLKHGDVVVFATDGFWDNVFISSSLDIITKHMISKSVWEQTEINGIVPAFSNADLNDGEVVNREYMGNLAYKLANTAYNNARNPKASTPFAKEFMQEWKMQYDGGKPDDTTVLVLYVQDNKYRGNDVKAKL